MSEGDDRYRAPALDKGLGEPSAPDPKYLRVLVDSHEGQHGGKVNVRVPFNLIRAGVRLATAIADGGRRCMILSLRLTP